MTINQQDNKPAKQQARKPTFAAVAPRPPIAPIAPVAATIRPGDDRLVAVMIRVTREARDRLKRIAIDRGTTVQQLVIDGLNRELAVDGLRPIDQTLGLARRAP